MKNFIFVQARVNSSRFPGKILKKVVGVTLLEYQFYRLKKINNIEDIIILTSKNKSDDQIVNLCKRNKIKYFRGDEEDVLKRFYEAALFFKPDNIVRINSDCPLIDPMVSDLIISHYIDNLPKYDYVSNILEDSYPIGFHTEIFSMNSLEIAHFNAKDSLERNHVTPYIYNNKNQFNITNIKYCKDLSNYRFTVDYEEDLKFISEIIKFFHKKNDLFYMEDIINFLNNNKNLLDINSNYIHKQNYKI